VENEVISFLGWDYLYEEPKEREDREKKTGEIDEKSQSWERGPIGIIHYIGGLIPCGGGRFSS